MKNDVKKLLTGLSIAGLLGTGGITLTGTHASGSG